MLKRQQGFTLIEMMITVVIVAVLAAIAFPAYQNYVEKARRSDAMDALLLIQNQQERWRANHSSYGTLNEIGVDSSSQEGYYSLSIDNISATSYTATATPTGVQASDDCGPNNGSMQITVDGSNPRGEKTPEECW